MITLPLEFGNITLALLTLVAAITIMYYLIEVGIYIIKKTLALDTEDAPDINIKNPILVILQKVPTRSFNTVIEDNGQFVIKDVLGRYYDTSDKSFWSRAYTYSSYFKTKEEASTYLKLELSSYWNTISVILLYTVVIDLLILLLQISFMPTLCITLTLNAMFCIRTLAKKFYTGMKKHGERLDEHGHEIEELKNKE